MYCPKINSSGAPSLLSIAAMSKQDLLDLQSTRTVDDDEPELIALAPGETSLNFLQCIYRSAKQPMVRPRQLEK
jgi:hypothetical protein